MPTTIDRDRLERAFELVRGWVREGVLPGAAAVVLRGRTVVGRCFAGQRRLGATDQPIGPETIFAVASVSKPVLAAGLFRLVEAGLVSVDQPVADWLPEFAGPGRDAVTIRRLLTHTSGLPRSWVEGFFLARTLAEYVAPAARLPLEYETGSRLVYSNAGYCLIGAIVERAGGADFETVMRREVFAPLGLTAIGYTVSEDLWPRVATVHDYSTPAIPYEPNSPAGRSVPRPWGSLFATADQIATFAAAFRPGPAYPLLGPAAIATMTRADVAGIPGSPDNPWDWPRTWWGLGYQVKGDRPHWMGDLASPTSYGHTGAYGTMLWTDPERDLTCVLLTNRAILDGWSRETLRHTRFSNAVLAAVRD